MSKPWFLRSKKLGDYSHLRRKEFNELREMVSDAVAETVREHSHPGWKEIKGSALDAIARLARKRHCSSRQNEEGGHICVYYHDDPVFALRIGNYSRHRVEDLLRGKALYRGIIDIVPVARPPIPDDWAPKNKRRAILERQFLEDAEPMKVFYYLLPTRVAGKWKDREALDMVDIIGVLKEHPGFSRSDIQHTLNFSPRKTIRLLGWLKSRRILHHRGSDKNSGWYLNRG
jgi:hypothetical protein